MHTLASSDEHGLRARSCKAVRAIRDLSPSNSEYKRRKAAIEPLRLAIERGQALDPELVRRLLGCDRHDKPLDPELLQIGGIITTAAGTGVALFAIFLSRVFPQWQLPIVGVGVLVICLGVWLIVGARVLKRNRAASNSVRSPTTDLSA
jgi:hypothetical protein